MVLRGHRSIVNQVRYNKHNNLIASSGVEKMVKLWTTLPVGKWNGSLMADYNELPRSVYSHDDYIYLVGHTGQRISHDYSDQSTQEDLRMLAFFDSLIQREIEGWESQSQDTFSSDSDSNSETVSLKNHLMKLISSYSLNLYEYWVEILLKEPLRLSWEYLLRYRKLSEETNRKQKPNRIAQLIAKKRIRLARMAHWKSSRMIRRFRLLITIK